MRDAVPEWAACCTLICCRARASAASRCARSRSMPPPCSFTLIAVRRTCATLPSATPGDALTPASLRGSVGPAGAIAAAAPAGTRPAAGTGPSAAASDSPDPEASSAASALTAAAASGPVALTRIASFGLVASSRMAVTDLAFAASAPRSNRMSARKVLAAAARTAAGLACNPWRLGKRMSAETAVAPGAGAPSTGAAAASSTFRMTLRPAATRPVPTVIPRMRSRFVTSTCVSRLGAERAMRSASNEISGCPAATRAPCCTRGVNPLPFRLTVSTPM